MVVIECGNDADAVSMVGLVKLE